MNRNTIGKLKSGAILINAGRGDLVDESALVEALESGQLGAAALDVFEQEPVAAASPLLKAPNLILSRTLPQSVPSPCESCAKRRRT